LDLGLALGVLEVTVQEVEEGVQDISEELPLLLGTHPVDQEDRSRGHRPLPQCGVGP
jgi:hypothetical protein